MYSYFYYYLVAINIIAFITAGLDKSFARNKKRRISEKTLFLLAIVGGSVGLYAAMLLFRHKTKHWYFSLGVPLLIILQIISLTNTLIIQ